MKDSAIHKDYAQKISDLINNLVILRISYSEQQKSVSAQQSKLSIVLTLEATNILLDSIKEKLQK